MFRALFISIIILFSVASFSQTDSLKLQLPAIHGSEKLMKSFWKLGDSWMQQ